MLFSTYATLVSATSGQKRSGGSRLSQLVEWCGGATFDGCLCFDECHKAKNYQPGKEESSSKVAQAVMYWFTSELSQRRSVPKCVFGFKFPA